MTAMMNVDKLKAGKNCNWFSWKTQVKGILLANELWGTVTGTEIDAGKVSKACGILLSNLSGSVIPYIPESHHEDPKKLWNDLKSKFEPQNSVLYLTVKQQIEQMSEFTDANVLEKINECQELYHRMASLGKEVSDFDQVFEIIKHLPPSFDVTRTYILNEIQSKSSFTVNDLALRVQSDLSSRPRQTLHAYHAKCIGNNSTKHSFKGNCRNCGKYGHKQSECWCPGGGASKDNSTQLRNSFQQKPKGSNVTRKQSAHFTTESGTDVCKRTHLFFTSAFLSQNCDNVISDSGATSHMSCKKEWFVDMKPHFEEVVLGDGRVIHAEGIGTLRLVLYCHEQFSGFMELQNCLYVPRLSTTLFSIRAATKDDNYDIIFDSNGFYIREKKSGSIIGTGYLSNGLFLLDCKPIDKSESHVNSTCNSELSQDMENNDEHCFAVVSADLWHQRFGHISKENLQKIIDKQMVNDLNLSGRISMSFCESCVLGKSTKLPFPKCSDYRATRTLQVIHTDVCGPISPESPSGSKYFLTFTDDYSRVTWVIPLKVKSQVFEEMKAFIEYQEKVRRQSVECIRSDNGGEYVNAKLESWLYEKRIRHEKSVPYCPQQNGVSERVNRTLCDRAAAMLHGSKLPANLWCEAILTAAYVKNRSPTKALDDKTPFEVYHGSKPSVKHLRVFGCKAYAYLHKNERTGKFAEKAECCTFLGYDLQSKGYRLWNSSRQEVIIRRHVRFDETSFGQANFDEDTNVDETSSASNFIYPYNDSNALSNCISCHENDSTHSEDYDVKEFHDLVDDNNENIENQSKGNDQTEGVRRTMRQNAGKAPQRLAYNNDYNQIIDECNESSGKALLSFALDLSEPKSLKEALSSDNSDLWKKAMEEEITSMKKLDVWDLVKRPENAKVIGSKWVLKYKYDENGQIERAKARLVALGNTQKYGWNYQETFSPVVHATAFRTFIALAKEEGMTIHQMDVKTAFLNGKLNEVVYMQQPEGHEVHGKEDMVCLLKKSIYGLKQSPRCWNQELHEHLTNFCFERCKSEPCIYKGNVDGQKVLLAVYVDDILIASKYEETIKKIKIKLQNAFEVKDLGKLHHFIGIRVKQEKDHIWIGQDVYTQSILERFNMSNSRPVYTPINPGTKLMKTNDSDKRFDNKLYQAAIGSLLYLSLYTRPDIAYAVSKLAKFSSDPTISHWQCVKHLLRYLQGTKKLGLLYKNGMNNIIAYADADFGGDLDDRKSTSGYVIMRNGGPLSWKSKKQTITAQSTAEAELIALNFAARDVAWITQLYVDMGKEIKYPTIIHEDNQSAIAICRSPINNNTNKHIAIKQGFIKDEVEQGRIEIEYIPSKEQLADIFTKPLSKSQFQILREQIGLSTMP